MTNTVKTLSAGLLTLAVIGGVGGVLTMSLADTHQQAAAQVISVQTTAPAIETVTVVGNRRAS
jgi:hypothetical protein